MPVVKIDDTEGLGKERDSEVLLVENVALKMPEEKPNWDEFFQTPAGSVSHEVAIAVAIESCGDR